MDFSEIDFPDCGVGLLQVFTSARHRRMGHAFYFEKNWSSNSFTAAAFSIGVQ
jgi:hypothetical protein